MEETMTAPQEAQTAAEEAQNREESLTRREAEVARRELRAQAMASLAERNLPRELADLLDYADEGRCTASLNTVQRLWQQAVQRGVESRVAGSVPRTGAGKGGARGTMREAISAYYGK